MYFCVLILHVYYSAEFCKEPVIIPLAKELRLYYVSQVDKYPTYHRYNDCPRTYTDCESHWLEIARIESNVGIFGKLCRWLLGGGSASSEYA